jgi:ABC-type antimicrobial peptide transport system permease subunit
VAIVNSKFARKYFENAPAVGRRIGLGNDPGTKTDIEIVGVVNDAHYENLREEIPEQVFLSDGQRETYGGTVYVQTDRDASSAFTSIRSVVRELDPNLPITNLKTFNRQISDSLITERLIATLSTVFGILATALVLIGLYGVMAFMVTRRSREIGIRMAVGAITGDVIWLVMREALVLIAIGLAIGIPAAFALTRIVQAQLYGIEPGDPMSMALATLLLVAATSAAAYIPVRRAAMFDPLRILRYE